MTGTTLTSTLLSCAFFMALVAWISYQKTKGEVSTQDGYFLAGRGLGPAFIAGSLLLTNLSAEQLIGLNGSAYGFNMSSMAWEVTAAVATVAMAFIFLPRYLSGAFATLPQFLFDRYDDSVRRMTVVLFMFGYGLITIPSVLYSGSIAVMQLFDVPAMLNLSYSQSLLATIFTIGSVGAVYAVFGGLRAVVISDTLNGVGLLIIGISVPLLGLSALGDGSLTAGLQKLAVNHPQKLNAIGSSSDPTPFGTLFTGMLFANLFYWCTNQYVIQRVLGARSLAAGQQGVLYSGFFKVLVPFLMMIPGIIAYHLYGPGLASIDLAYPRLIRDVLPVYALGFFLAVLLGAVFSSFNSLLNSAATLFCLDVYAPLKKKAVSDQQMVRVAKWASIAIALLSFSVAPLLQFAPEGLWQIIRIFTGFYNIPVIAIVLVGLFTTRVPALAAKMVIVFHIISYALCQFVLKEFLSLHFLHVYAILFIAEVAIMLAIGWFMPDRESSNSSGSATHNAGRHAVVDMTPWPLAIPCAFTLLSCVVGLYLLFSPLGLAGGIGKMFYGSIGTLLALNAALWIWFAHRTAAAPSVARANRDARS